MAPVSPPRAKSLWAAADEWLSVQGAGVVIRVGLEQIACTHTLMHCLLFAVFFDEERALLLDGVYGLSSINGA